MEVNVFFVRAIVSDNLRECVVHIPMVYPHQGSTIDQMTWAYKSQNSPFVEAIWGWLKFACCSVLNGVYFGVLV